MGDILKFRRRRRRKFSYDWGVPVSKRKGPSQLLLILIGLALGTCAGLGFIYWPILVPAQQEASSTQFGFCHVGGGINCVVDGDTFWFNGERIRVADIDTPETHPPRCATESELGNRATQRLHELLNAGPFSLELPCSETRINMVGSCGL